MAAKVVVGIMTPGEQPRDNGRVVHALKLAKGLKDAGAELVVVFEGKGVDWLERLTNITDDSHPFDKHYGPIFEEIREHVVACNMCCKRFNALEAAEGAGLRIEGEGSAHVAIERYVLDGYQVINH